MIRSLTRFAMLGCLVAVTAVTATAGSTTVTLNPDRDNSLFEEPTGALSNGAGEYLFAGTTLQGFQGSPELDLRRALLHFDVDGNVPAGATILSATLSLKVTKSISGSVTGSMHRLTADWGEGTSDADFQEGMGIAATAGDATWLENFFGSSSWTSAGGDFNPTASATASVGGDLDPPVEWDLTADVQDMLDNPAGNFGWILINDEGTVPGAKQFASRENATAANRPSLEIEYITTDALTFCQGIDGVNTLEVNGDNGTGSSNTVAVNSAGPIAFFIDKPGAGGNGKFLVSMNAGPPTGPSIDMMPAQLGASCFTYLLSRGAAPVAQWNGIGKVNRVGASFFFGNTIGNPGRAPLEFFSAPTGDPNLMPGQQFTIQGLIINPGASSPKGASVTNAILVDVQ